MKAKSLKGKNAAEIKAALETSMAEGLTPTVAIVFLEAELPHQELCTVLTEKGIQVFGASSGSNFTDGEIEKGSIVVLLLDINPEFFRIEFCGDPSLNTKEKAMHIAKSGKDTFRKPAFLLMTGGLTIDGDEVLDGIESICGKTTTIYGGLAADSLKVQRTFVFTNDKLTDNGIISLVLDEEKITLAGMAVGGWKPIGIDRVITHSEGNIVYTIDNEPAMDFLLRYAGIKQFDIDNSLNFILASNFQLQLLRDNKHPVMRTPMWANKEEKSVVFAGSMPQGSKTRLCLLPGFEIIEATVDAYTKYKSEQAEADALVMFSCAGRQITLGPYVSDEIERIKNIWNAPLAGYFCFGEFGRVEQQVHEFHNMTCSLAILKEK